MNFGAYTRLAKVAAVALVAVSLVACGWAANGWRMGEELAELQARVERKEAARVSALNERQQKAMGAALGAVLEALARLKAERQANAKAVAKAVREAPKAPEFKCLDLPLPEPYLENFRQ